MITVKSIKKTSRACPAQWDGLTDDNKTVYVRYRFGQLRIEVDKNPVFTMKAGEGYDGFMDFERIKQFTENQIVWPKTEELENDI